MEHAGVSDLIQEAKRGNQHAFTELLRPLLEPGFRLAVGMLLDRALAEDAVQEAAVKAWRKIRQLRDGRPVSPWFLGIVANECRTIRRGRWWQVLKGDRPSALRAQSDQVDTGVDLRRALSRLSADQRLVIVLYFYLDLPLDQIAITTRSSYAAVRGRLYRGLRKLRVDPALLASL